MATNEFKGRLVKNKEIKNHAEAAESNEELKKYFCDLIDSTKDKNISAFLLIQVNRPDSSDIETRVQFFNTDTEDKMNFIKIGVGCLQESAKLLLLESLEKLGDKLDIKELKEILKKRAAK